MIGSEFAFGHYKQGSNGEIKEIIWLVLDVRENRSLLLSKYCLNAAAYQSQGRSIEWKQCSLREQMNHGFLQEAFSEREQAAIMDYQSEKARDRVFFLSKEEVKKYLPAAEKCIVAPTDYASKQEIYMNDLGNCYWWLRVDQGAFDLACVINSEGQLDRVSASSTGIGIRPAIWIDI